ncbi:Pyruvate dehydrogenase E1 component subunit beta-1, mitochondrial [Capsicum baccatum]|uniref:Pyruvate dehydrogenase E1 component subunit beta n=1 Tax=Capsicum baccatum TaxID=33114 RepID=A0A2G2XQR4_CAPBA|nr:Pyruvate dehydrogenase E1 component subunit beta-1, mitochondrial [Capsicum baccatum]
MIMLTVRVDKDVINEDYDEHVQVQLNYMIHQVYEIYWGIDDSHDFCRTELSSILRTKTETMGEAEFYGDYMCSDVLSQAMDHLVNSAAKGHYMSGGNISVLVVFRGPNGTALGVGAQHSQDKMHFEKSISQKILELNLLYDDQYAVSCGMVGTDPGLSVVALYLSEDARGLLKATIKDPNAVVFLMNELLYGKYFPLSDEVLDPSFTFPIGNAKIEKEGRDVIIALFLWLFHFFSSVILNKTKYSHLNNVPVYNQYRSSAATTSSTFIGGGSEGGNMVAAITASSSGGKDEQMAKNGMAMVILQYL